MTISKPKTIKVIIPLTKYVTGVSKHKQTNKWRAYIEYNQKYIHLGLFNTKEEAINKI